MKTTDLDALRDDEIRAWLERALGSHEPVPSLTPDEPPYLGVLRLDKQVKPITRQSLCDGCLALLDRFCEYGEGEQRYALGLISLSSAFSAAFKRREVAERLANLAQRFPVLPELSADVRFAVLGALVDAPPPRMPDFWREILRQDPQGYASLALAGVLSTYPLIAVDLLPEMPDDESDGDAAALNVDLTWDELAHTLRSQFVEKIQWVLPRCGPRFAAPLRIWAGSKGVPAAKPIANPTLLAALRIALDSAVTPLAYTPKLCFV